MDTGDMDQSSSSQSYQNLKHGRQHELSNTESVTRLLTCDGRQELDHIIPECDVIPECDRSCLETKIRKEEPQKTGTHGCILPLIVVLLGICISYGAWKYTEIVEPPLSVTVTKSEREKYLRMDIQNIRDEFPSQLKTTWRAFSAGIKRVQETPTKPSVFLLLHETEEGTPACLAWKIGNISAHFLNATNPNPVVLDGANIERNQTLAEDSGILLTEYHPMLQERCTMIVKDLHKIPGIVAQSFHWFCDTVTPFVDKAIYLFTMKASGVSHADNPTKVAEEELKKLWNGQLDEDKLMPLIVRITHSVLVIMPEKHHMSCPDEAIVSERELL
jgi:hypothetical protein